jgi:hypothetical protein
VQAAASLADDVMALQSPEARVEGRVEELERRIARLGRPRSRSDAPRARSLLHGFRGL